VIHDISPVIDEAIAVWPGDSPFRMSALLRLAQGDSVDLSTITLSCHTGAHADAPGHYVDGGRASWSTCGPEERPWGRRI
jgi:arylformamidase